MSDTFSSRRSTSNEQKANSFILIPCGDHYKVGTKKSLTHIIPKPIYSPAYFRYVTCLNQKNAALYNRVRHDGHDVSAEKRDKFGRWTNGDEGSQYLRAEKRQNGKYRSLLKRLTKENKNSLGWPIIIHEIHKNGIKIPVVMRHPIYHTIPSSTSRIPAEIIQAAQTAEKRWHVPASISIVQWILESGYGKHMPKGSNNPFGIKEYGNEPGVYTKTREEDKNHHIFYIVAKFRKFASIAEAFDQRAKLLATNPAYEKVRRYIKEPDKYADALTGVYATDHRYGRILKSIMHKYNLYQYNHK